jgi:hypothetical protein
MWNIYWPHLGLLIKNLLDFSRSRDQRLPGSFLHKRKNPGYEVGHISKSDDTALNLNISHHVYALPGIVILDEPIILHHIQIMNVYQCNANGKNIFMRWKMDITWQYHVTINSQLKSSKNKKHVSKIYTVSLCVHKTRMITLIQVNEFP